MEYVILFPARRLDAFVSPGIYHIQNGFLSRTKAALLRLQLQERDSEGPREPPGTSQSSYNAMTGEQDQL